MDAAENRLLVESGPGTPGGEVLRRYWQPAALSEELAGDRPLVEVTLLGEELVLFRDELGSLGLVSRWCPHRGVDLSYGRLEDGGLRCPFHGWLFDVSGACLQTPAEPPESTFRTRVRLGCYPVVERNGVVWAWMGGGEPPPLPGLDAFVAPSTHTFAFKGMWDCNWLQAQEVGLDAAHAAFLHRFLEGDDEVYGQQFRATVADTGIPVTKLMREAGPPRITAEPTAYGFRTRTLRDYAGALTSVRISNCIFPNGIAIAMSPTMAILQWHVPLNDVRCYWYSVFVSYGDPVDAATMRAQRVGAVELPAYRSRVGRAQRWGYDPAEQRQATYTGMGQDINVHDQWAVESPGPIFDRTREHLTPTDVGIRTHRRLYLAALRSPGPDTLIGTADPAALRGPAAIDAATSGDDVDECWRALDRRRRAASGWAPPLEQPDGP
jgi:phthalate 4,5-dioxygenase oxygenase subunit